MRPWQVHTPPMQALPVCPQPLPHAPQWLASAARSRQEPWQQVWPAAQARQTLPLLPQSASLVPAWQVEPSQQPAHRSPLQVHVPP